MGLGNIVETNSLYAIAGEILVDEKFIAVASVLHNRNTSLSTKFDLLCEHNPYKFDSFSILCTPGRMGLPTNPGQLSVQIIITSNP